MPNIHRIELPTPYRIGPVNVYILLGDVITLIDVGPDTPEALQLLKQNLRVLGLKLADIDQIVLTHLHGDHVGLLHILMQESEASIYVHAKGEYSFHNEQTKPEYGRQATIMQEYFTNWGVSKHTFPFKANRYYNNPIDLERLRFLQHGDSIFGGNRSWRVLYAPGHSQLDICLYDPHTGEILVGDHMLPNVTPAAFLEAPFPGEKDRPRALVQYIDSLTMVSKLPVTTVYPGHGMPFANHLRWIQRRLQKVELRCEGVYQHIKYGKNTVFELCQTMFPQLVAEDLYTALSEVVGYLDVLLQRNQISVKKVGEIEHYDLERSGENAKLGKM